MPSPTRFFSPAAPPPEPLSVDSDVVVILAALLCALICVVGLAFVARCTCIRRSSAPPPPQIPANKGLKKKALRSLPTESFRGSPDGRPAECPICLTEFQDGEVIRVLPQCGHEFHVGCIDTWLGSHSSCPSCRQILVVACCQKCGGLPAAEGQAKAAAAAEVDPDRFLP